MLPEIVSAAAAPLASVDKMTMISADGANSLTRSVASNVAQGLELSSDLTGVDIKGLLTKLGGTAALAAGSMPAGATPNGRRATTTTARSASSKVIPIDGGPDHS